MKVQYKGFHDLINFLEPDYKVPCRKTVTGHIEKLFEEAKTALLEKLRHTSSSVSLTTDCWTSLTHEGYMTVTAHFIDENWQYNTAVLNTLPVGQLPVVDSDEEGDEEQAPQPVVRGPQRHTSAALGAELLKVAQDWELESKVEAVVHDNASNVKRIAEAVEAEDVPCAVHILQLSVKKGLEVAQVKRLNGAACRLGHFYKKSTIATKALEQVQKDTAPTKDVHRLISSCKTRWNSTYEMMQRLLELRWFICSVLSNAEYTAPTVARTLELTNNQWAVMQELVKCLEPLQVILFLYYSENKCIVLDHCASICCLMMLHRRQSLFLSKTSQTTNHKQF